MRRASPTLNSRASRTAIHTVVGLAAIAVSIVTIAGVFYLTHYFFMTVVLSPHVPGHHYEHSQTADAWFYGSFVVVGLAFVVPLLLQLSRGLGAILCAKLRP